MEHYKLGVGMVLVRYRRKATQRKEYGMTSMLKKTFACLLLGGGILLTAPGAFADWYHRHHHHHHHYYRPYYYNGPYYNRDWSSRRRYYPQYRYSYRTYGPYAGYWDRYRHHDD